MSLHSLPPELLLRVLREFDDPNDLVSAISASSACLRAFNSGPKHTIKTVLTKCMSSECLQIALALVSFTLSKSLAPAQATNQAMPGPSSAEDQGEPKCQTFNFPETTDALMAMLRTHRQISSFVRDFAERAARIIKEHSPASETGEITITQTWVPMSSAEQARFERAFYRHELYSQISPGGTVNPFAPELKPMFNKYGLFVNDLKPWIEDEMITVHEYLKNVVRRAVRDLNDELVMDVYMETKVDTQLRMKSIQPEDIDAYRHLLDVYNNSEQGTELTEISSMLWHGRPKLNLLVHDRCGVYNCRWWASYFVLKGVRSLAHLSAKFLSEKHLLMPDSGNIRLFPEEIVHLTGIEYARDFQILHDKDIDAGEDGNRSGTLGWRTFRAYSRCTTLPGDTMTETAYLFWDAERIRTPWVMSALMTAKLTGSVADLEKQESETWGKSAGERLAGVRLPRAVCETILREYGQTEWRALVKS